MAGQGKANPLYDVSGGLPCLVRSYEEAVSKSGARLNVALLYSHEDPAREMLEWAPDDKRPGVVRAGGGLVLTLDKGGEVPVRVAIAESGRRPNVYYALSDCPAKDFKARFLSLVSRHVPTLSRTLLSSADMRGIVKAVTAKTDARVKFVSSRFRRPPRLKFISRIDHVDEPAEKLASGADGHEEIRTVRLACMPRGPAGGDAAASPEVVTMTRDCRFSARSGAGVLFDAVLPRAEDLAAKRGERLRAVAGTADRRAPEPLIVNFARKVFADPKNNGAHIDAIAAMPHAAIGEYHSDHYIHLSLVDYMDCSSYDIWVLVSNKLAIIPQFSASGASMGRLVNHILEKFGDATIEKYAVGGRGGR